MNPLARVFVVKIAATLLFWCVPLICFPTPLLVAIGMPTMSSFLFVRLLGWAYLALCAGYAFGLRAALKGERAEGPIWMGIVSNGGACALLVAHGIAGAWAAWGAWMGMLMWASVLATAAITAGLYWHGVRATPTARPGEGG